MLRLWCISSEDLVNYVNVQDYITTISAFPEEQQVIIGTHTGKCLIYGEKNDLILRPQGYENFEMCSMLKTQFGSQALVLHSAII